MEKPSLFTKIINLIFPLTTALRAKKIISLRLEILEKADEDSDYMRQLANSSIDDAERVYQTINENRKSLIDKAKVNVFGITMAITFIVGMAKVFSSINCPSELHVFFLISIIFTLLALINMIISGFVSLSTLQGQKNYDIMPIEFQYLSSLESDKQTSERVQLIARNSEINGERNLLINNMVSASYGFLRNGLLFLLLSALLIGYISYRKVRPSRSNLDIFKEYVDLKTQTITDSVRFYNEKIDTIITNNKLRTDLKLENIKVQIDTLIVTQNSRLNKIEYLLKRRKTAPIKKRKAK